jgi:hypothetical protein
MLERKFTEQATVGDKYRKVTATAALAVSDQVVLAYATAGADVVITLPNVSEAAGLIYSIYCKDVTAPQTITIQDQDESLGWADMVMTADNDRVVLYSDGISWAKLVDITT